jgi:uncharacterized RDD family membrane protein YckC
MSEEFEKARIARRLLASFIDFIIFCALFFLWPINKGVWGQDFGKRCLEVKVVAKNNEPISLGQAFGRFFMGFVDLVFSLEIIVAAVNENNQRIGDAAAVTFVVKSTCDG